uniref:Amiloride-sensitive sodium channel subunit beta n=1 Tax=Rhabditophanes sp. KR3021 TaxID=114890 RepID=A0AC35TKR9_9BILA
MPSKFTKLFTNALASDGDKHDQNTSKRNSGANISKNSIVVMRDGKAKNRFGGVAFSNSQAEVQIASPDDLRFMDEALKRDLSLSSLSSIIYNNSVIRDDHKEPEKVSNESSSTTQPNFLSYLEYTNVDGIRHIRSDNFWIKNIWKCLFAFFFFCAVFQIYSQSKMYINHPVSTNIEAHYPPQINFPTVAICNTNQYRLTYLTGPNVLNRKLADNQTAGNFTDIFDKALNKARDLDAVRFLRNAAHWKSRMILKCEYPNGTSCPQSAFHAVWTLTGLCWAINTDVYNPVMINGAGPNNALKLLLNVERYERIEGCSEKVRSKSLPGIKILIYNQTDIPLSSMDGVNVPPGFTMDIPFRMQHRVKIPGQNCVDENLEDKVNPKNFVGLSNIKACAIRKQMEIIEQNCDCSIRRAYDPNPTSNMSFCNVQQYFDCVAPLVQKKFDTGVSDENCKASCETIDYIAWQDMNELPNNIFPKLIDTDEEEDEQDVDDFDFEDEKSALEEQKETHFQCEDNQHLPNKIISRIKREAQRAYEKQTRYQEDIQIRNTRLIERFRVAAKRINDLKWGWNGNQFVGVYDRLSKSVECYGNMSLRHADIFSAITDPNILNEERKTNKTFLLVDEETFYKDQIAYKTISDLKREYLDKIDETLEKINDYQEMMMTLVKIYDDGQYLFKLSPKLERMERIIALIKQYEDGKLQRRVWADKMASRNMRHFMEEEIYELWYNVITKDIDTTLLNSISRIEHLGKKVVGDWDSEEAINIGVVLLFGTKKKEKKDVFKEFLEDIVYCTMQEVKNKTLSMQEEYKKSVQNFQSAYTNLFKKELKEYLEKFEFGQTFVRENFAQVNVFLHKMNIEYWQQQATYSFWSFACDVGGALGLFLGASLLTLIELVYMMIAYGVFTPKFWKKNQWFQKHKLMVKDATTKIWNGTVDQIVKIKNRKNLKSSEDDSDASDVYSRSTKKSSFCFTKTKRRRQKEKNNDYLDFEYDYDALHNQDKIRSKIYESKQSLTQKNEHSRDVDLPDLVHRKSDASIDTNTSKEKSLSMRVYNEENNELKENNKVDRGTSPLLYDTDIFPPDIIAERLKFRAWLSKLSNTSKFWPESQPNDLEETNQPSLPHASEFPSLMTSQISPQSLSTIIQSPTPSFRTSSDGFDSGFVVNTGNTDSSDSSPKKKPPFDKAIIQPNISPPMVLPTLPFELKLTDTETLSDSKTPTSSSSSSSTDKERQTFV